MLRSDSKKMRSKHRRHSWSPAMFSKHVSSSHSPTSGPHVQLTLLAKADSASPEKGGISGPKAVDNEKKRELQTDKLKTLRQYYDKVRNDYERSLAEYNETRTKDNQIKYENNEALLNTLAQQIQTLTGVHPESPVSTSSQGSPKPTTSPSPSAAVNNTQYVINTPPPGGTNSNANHSTGGSSSSPHHLPPASPSAQKSGDALDNIQEESSNSSSTTATPESSPRKSVTQAHKRSESLPESAFDQVVKAAGPVPMDDGESSLSSTSSDKFHPRTASLPTSGVHDSSDQSPSRSPAPSSTSSEMASRSHEEIASTHETPPQQRPINAKQVQHLVMPQQVQVLSMEDEDFSTDDEHKKSVWRHSWPGVIQKFGKYSNLAKLEEHGPFGDLNQLKGRPGHLAVFVYYLMSNADPAPLFFYLVTEQYTQGSHKELKKWAYEIYSTFLHEKAPLRVEFDGEVVQGVERVLEHLVDKEEALRSVFQVARHQSQNIISDMLEDFRNKRAMGLASLYGDKYLQDEPPKDHSHEVKIAENVLWPEFERLLGEPHSSERNQALLIGMATLFRFIGISSQKSSTLDRVSSFMMKDKKTYFKGNKKKVVTMKGHGFRPTEYILCTFCNQCQGLIWGVGQQGFQCMHCEYNAHKACMEMVKDNCTKKRPGDDGHKKSNRKSGIYNRIVRRTTGNNPNIIENSKRMHQEEEARKLNPSQRTISLPTGINIKGDKRTSFYVQTPPSTPVGKHMPNDLLESDNVRDAKSGWVKHQVENFEGDQHLHHNSQHNALSSASSAAFFSSHPSSSSSTNHKSPSSSAAASLSSVKSPPRGSSPEPMDSDQKIAGLNIGRSESLNKKGEKRKKSVRRTRSDVQVDDQTLKTLHQSESSSTSSLSNRLESPSQSQDGLSADTTSHLGPTITLRFDDSDFDVEPDLPSLDQVIPKELLKKLKPKDKKRQDVINELFYTERNHVRNLKIMTQVFYVRMIGEHWIPKDLVKLLFPNLEEMITLHSELNHSFIKKKDEHSVVSDIAQLLLDRFDGEAGDMFKKACAKCCCDSTHANEVLRHRLRKDQKFNTFISDLNSNPLCRKLDLKSFLPVQMMRLTKYPLLIENLMKYTPSQSDEHRLLQRACQLAKDTLAYVNEKVKDKENWHRIEELQKRMDKRPIENSTHALLQNYKDLDLRRHNLVYEGNLVWRINKQKAIDMYVVLFEDIVVLFQKQDDKLVLRCQSTMLVQGKDDTKFTHSPIIVTSNCMVKQVATDKKGLFLVSMLAPPQVYELVCSSTDEKKIWFKHLSLYAKMPEGGSKRGSSMRPASTHVPTSISAGQIAPTPAPEESAPLTVKKKSASVEDIKTSSENSSSSSKVHVQETEAETGLIQPEEVQVNRGLVVDEKAGLLQSLQEQDDVIKLAMQKKIRVLSHHLDVPYDDFESIAELSSEEPAKKDSSHILLAAIHQSNRLTQLVNSSLTSIPNKRYSHPEPRTSDLSGTGDEKSSHEVMLSVGQKELSSVASNLSEQMRQLLASIREREEDHQRMQHQLKSLQDQVRMYRAIIPSGSAPVTDPASPSPTSPTAAAIAASSATLSTEGLPPPLAIGGGATMTSSLDGDATPTPALNGELQKHPIAVAQTSRELHISETELSGGSGGAVSRSPSGSRPVSMISVTSEKSMTSEDGDADVETDDEMAQTLKIVSSEDLALIVEAENETVDKPPKSPSASSSAAKLEDNSTSCDATSSVSVNSTQNETETPSAILPKIHEHSEAQITCSSQDYDTVEKLEVLASNDSDDNSSICSENERLEIVEEKDEEEETIDSEKSRTGEELDSKCSQQQSPETELKIEDDGNDRVSTGAQNSDSEEDDDKDINIKSVQDQTKDDSNTPLPLKQSEPGSESSELQSKEDSGLSKDVVENQEGTCDNADIQGSQNHTETSDSDKANMQNISEPSTPTKIVCDDTKDSEQNKGSITELTISETSETVHAEIITEKETSLDETSTPNDKSDEKDIELVDTNIPTEQDSSLPLKQADTQNMDCQTEDDPEILAMCDSYNEYDEENDFADAQTDGQTYADVDGVQVIVQDKNNLESNGQGQTVDSAKDSIMVDDGFGETNENSDCQE